LTANDKPTARYNKKLSKKGGAGGRPSNSQKRREATPLAKARAMEV
jgi:hypothetical protein